MSDTPLEAISKRRKGTKEITLFNIPWSIKNPEFFCQLLKNALKSHFRHTK